MSQIKPDKITSENTKTDESEEVYNNIPSTTPRRSSRNIDWFQSPKFKKLPRSVRVLYNNKNPLSKEYLGYAFVGAVTSGYLDPNTYREAMSRDDKLDWEKAINKELDTMKEKGVWEVIDKSEVPCNRMLLGSKWVFKKKKDGQYRARLVAKGYNQIPGVDFTDLFAPVMNDITFQIILILVIIYGWDMTLINVEAAFLNGKLYKKIYKKPPDGMNLDQNKCLALKQAIYGLVQAAHQWWKKFTAVLINELNFKESLADPCLLQQTTSKGKIFFGL